MDNFNWGVLIFPILFPIIFGILSYKSEYKLQENKKPEINYISPNFEGTKLVTLEFNGEKHEYVYFHQGFGSGSLSHWENCKYCSHANHVQTDEHWTEHWENNKIEK